MLNTKPYTAKLQNKMKATSKFIMAATLVMVVTLAIVLGLILVLLAELYCSLLLHRRHLRKKTNSNTTIPTSATPPTTTISKPPPLLTPHSPPSPPPPPPPFASAYSQGVLQAPRSFLFPCKDEQNPTPRGIGLVSLSSPSPLASFLARAPPPQSLQPAADEKPCGGGVEHLVYISNPIYENELEAKASRVNTPFETPNTSPSRLERSGSSGEDDDRNGGGACGCSHSPPSLTPPLTPMKKLPAEGSSVSLRDATSLGTSGSDTQSINGPSSSSSSSDTPSTSPSW